MDRGEKKRQASAIRPCVRSLASKYSLRYSCVTLSSPVQSKRCNKIYLQIMELIIPDLQIGHMLMTRTPILFRGSPRESWPIINLKWTTASFLGLML
ncbi:hypothetical protein NPIL_8951 [Nephila pilipes]|uniref:Uncharacterized protein n=1 Tax=Nephila pilipes TaxID=299642 RepID=A0A8X6R2A4_NEPPI|nr:hypothetical protein NPIL_8951 [Nephila pilipes]